MGQAEIISKSFFSVLSTSSSVKQPLMRQGNCPAVMLHCRVNLVWGISRKSVKMRSSLSPKVLLVSGP